MWKLTLGYRIGQVRINTNPQDGRISNGCTSLPKNIHMGANFEYINNEKLVGSGWVLGTPQPFWYG
jgi:hypothetical protein